MKDIMTEGNRVLAWAHQKGYTLTWLADQLGYTRQQLSHSLNNNQISRHLADALFEHFGLRVISRRTYGRPAGANRTPGSSRLTPHKEEIIRLLAQGTTQRYIAAKYGVRESTLHSWMRRNGLIRTRLPA